MAYSGFRGELGPAQYPRDKTPVTVDYSLTSVISAFLFLYISFLVILPGFRGKQRIIIFSRFTIFHLIGMAIIVSLFGQSWEVAWVSNAMMPYRAGVKGEIHANLGVHIGLTSVNITLKGVPEKPNEGPGAGHRINYNERFYFSGAQGRIGFGRYSGRINREFRAAQRRGMPFPILWIAEYFIIDGEDILWGRSYRLSGFYANIMLWTAWSLWIVAVILSFSSIQVCSEILMLCGSSMLCSNVFWASIRYGSELVIPVASQQFLRFTFGWTFYLCLFAGILTLIFGFLVMILNFFRPYEATLFFFLESLEEEDSAIKRVTGNAVVPLRKTDKRLSNVEPIIRVDQPMKLEDVDEMLELTENKINVQNGKVYVRPARRQEHRKRSLQDAFRVLKESN